MLLASPLCATRGDEQTKEEWVAKKMYWWLIQI